MSEVLAALVHTTPKQSQALPASSQPMQHSGSGRSWPSNPQSSNNTLCFHCKAEGHFARECQNRLPVTPTAGQMNQLLDGKAMEPHPNDVRLSQPAPGQSQQ